jgi:hypothetical protein
MWIGALFLLLLLLAWNLREPFTIHVEGELPTLNVGNVMESIQNHTTRPLYKMAVRNMPYREQYRKWRRHINNM